MGRERTSARSSPLAVNGPLSAEEQQRRASRHFVIGWMMRRHLCLAAFSRWALLVLFWEASPEALAVVDLGDECGSRPAVAQTVGGDDVELGAWPWQVSLQIYRVELGGYRHECGGCLINNNSVLTVARCIKKWVNPEYWRAVVGLHHLYKPQSHTRGRRIKSIIVHSDFKLDSYENDIAIFELLRFIEYNKYIQPICLPHVSHLVDDKPCYISGWQQRKKGKFQPKLQEAPVEIIPLQICNEHKWYKGRIPANMICAVSQSGNVSSYEGEIGGPLMCRLPNVSKYYLIGITSYAIGCQQHNYPGVYVHTVGYRNWIDLNLHAKTTAVRIQSVLVLLPVKWAIFHLL